MFEKKTPATTSPLGAPLGSPLGKPLGSPLGPSTEHPHDLSPVQTQPVQNSNAPGPGETGYVPVSVAEHAALHNQAASAQSSGTPVINKPSFEEVQGTVTAGKPLGPLATPFASPTTEVTTGSPAATNLPPGVVAPVASVAGPTRDHLGRLTHDAAGHTLHYVGDTDELAPA